MNDDLLIHIGYHKSGSSYLQHMVFANPALPFGLLKRNHPMVTQAIRFEHPYLFDPAAVRSVLDQQCDDMRAQGRVPVLSHEGLSGHIFAGGFDSITNAERLGKVAPQARILIVIREQDSMLLSFYNQYIRRGGREKMRSFLRHTADARTHFHPAHLAYHHLIETYHTVFGPDRVLALPYELLRQGADAYVARITEFAKRDGAVTAEADLAGMDKVINPSIPPTGIAIKRQLNRFIGRSDYGGINARPWKTIGASRSGKINSWLQVVGHKMPASWNRSIDEDYRAAIRDEIGDFYHASNAKTAQLTGIDLAQLGYRT